MAELQGVYCAWCNESQQEKPDLLWMHLEQFKQVLRGATPLIRPDFCGIACAAAWVQDRVFHMQVP